MNASRKSCCLFQRCLTFFAVMFFLSWPVWGASSDQNAADIKPVRLRCEYLFNPLGIDATKPRLSWELRSDLRNQRQTAYRILVATSLDDLNNQTDILWDSGKVSGDQSLHIEYDGQPLRSGQRCYWQVKVWDGEDRVSDWSDPAWWEMGLLKPDDWQAQWISDGRSMPQADEDFYSDDPAPLFRKTFSTEQDIRRARLYMTGLGWYAVRLNGTAVSEHTLEPAWTNYAKRVFYHTYDVADQLRSGTNCLGVTLGNGWFNPLPLRMWGRLNLREHLPVGRPRFIARLDIEYNDGSVQSVTTDASWKVTQGPLLRNNVFLGEVYDARKAIPRWDQPDYDDSAWSDAVVVDAPEGQLQAQPLPPIEPFEPISPVAVTEPDEGVFIFDMGRNFTGTIELTAAVPEGTRIKLRYGELLNEQGQLNPLTSVCGQIKAPGRGGPGAPDIAYQQDTYIAAGSASELYRPAFTFHAFRYIEMTGYPGTPEPDMIQGIPLRTAVDRVGTFSCSNDLLNQIQQMCVNTFESNIMSVQSDCPHRERFAYGGDIVVSCDALMLNYDMSTFYPKTVFDFGDAARPDGMLTDTAPFVGVYYCGIGWAMVHPLLQQQTYRFYGNRRLIEQQYAVSRRWFDRVLSDTPDLIVTRGLSDHESLVPTPAPPLVTPLFYQSARMVSRLASILGKDSDARRYADVADRIKQAYIDQFVDPETGLCGPGTQAAQSFVLYSEMIDNEDLRKAAVQRLVEDIQVNNDGKLTTGIFGVRYMLEVLSRESHSEVAYALVNHREFPGWGYMLKHGATTLWEHWRLSENTFSHNHPMFGSVSQWFFSWLGGIQPADDAVGFDRIDLRPQFIEDLDWVQSTYHSMRGPITSNWRRSGGHIHLAIHIPANTVATLRVPVDCPRTIKESNQAAATSEGIEIISSSEDGTVLRFGSGTYAFVIPDTNT